MAGVNHTRSFLAKLTGIGSRGQDHENTTSSIPGIFNVSSQLLQTQSATPSHITYSTAYFKWLIVK